MSITTYDHNAQALLQSYIKDYLQSWWLCIASNMKDHKHKDANKFQYYAFHKGISLGEYLGADFWRRIGSTNEFETWILWFSAKAVRFNSHYFYKKILIKIQLSSQARWRATN